MTLWYTIAGSEGNQNWRWSQDCVAMPLLTLWRTGRHAHPCLKSGVILYPSPYLNSKKWHNSIINICLPSYTLLAALLLQGRSSACYLWHCFYLYPKTISHLKGWRALSVQWSQKIDKLHWIRNKDVQV